MHSAEEFVRAVSQRVQDLVELAEAETRLAALSGLTANVEQVPELEATRG